MEISLTTNERLQDEVGWASPQHFKTRRANPKVATSADHAKHHHDEGNGPNDLSSTLRYQRDDLYHFLHYVGRFCLLIWLDLPLYFIRSGQLALAVKAASWELCYYLALYILWCHHARATFVLFILPLLLLRLGLMVGNWGQHAFVDHQEPDSDYRSSITLIDVQVSSEALDYYNPFWITVY